MKTLKDTTEKAIEEFMEIVTLMELDNDDGNPLYKDGDMRIGAKKKNVEDFIRKTRLDACREMLEATRVEKDLIPITITHTERVALADGRNLTIDEIQEKQNNFLNKEE